MLQIVLSQSSCQSTQGGSLELRLCESSARKKNCEEFIEVFFFVITVFVDSVVHPSVSESEVISLYHVWLHHKNLVFSFAPMKSLYSTKLDERKKE